MIEISGIPFKDDKNCEEILLNLLQKVGVDLAESDIEGCHLISRKQDAPIITKLV